MNESCMIICLLSVVGTALLSSLGICLCSYCSKPKEINRISLRPPPYEEHLSLEEPTIDILPPAYIEVEQPIR